MKALAAAALLLLCAAGAQASEARAVCFVGPVFLAGMADNACLNGERAWKRLMDVAVVDWTRKPIPLTMLGESAQKVKAKAKSKTKEKLVVTTCRQWLQAISMSRAAMHAQDHGREAFYERTCLTLDQLKFAEQARKTFLATGGKDLLKPSVVPARVLEQAGIKGPLPLPGATVGELSKAGELVLRDRKTGMMEVTWRTVDLALNPVAQGDFDRDGVEDLAIAMQIVRRGSGRAGTMIVFITRRSKRGAIEVMYPKPRG